MDDVLRLELLNNHSIATENNNITKSSRYKEKYFYSIHIVIKQKRSNSENGPSVFFIK